MESLQKRALRIIQPDLSYAEALVALDITLLYERRQALSKALFVQIVRDQSHKLHDLLPPRNGSPIAPEARDTSNYRFVRQIGLKTLLSWKTVLIIIIIIIIISIFPFLYYIKVI